MRGVTCGVLGVLATLCVAGCGDPGTSAHDYAKSACKAYQGVGRVQISATVEQAAAIRDLARSDVRAAAAFDPRWKDLSSDMQSALALEAAMLDSPDARSNRFFEVDERVQRDCRDAGQDIGDLKP